MSCRIRSLLIAVVLCSSQLSVSQYLRNDIGGGKVVGFSNEKKWAVEERDSDGQIIASIPIEKKPLSFFYSKFSNSVYVIQTADGGEHNTISIVNLTTRKVDQVPLSAGTIDALMSRDERRLYVYTRAQRAETGPRSVVMPYPSMVEDAYAGIGSSPLVTAIDTTTNKVIAAYRWTSSFQSSHPKTKYLQSEFYSTQDGERLIAAFQGRSLTARPEGQEVAILSGSSSDPVFMTDPGAPINGVGVSLDEKKLFVFTKGEEKHTESVTIVNTETKTKAAYPLPNPLPDHTRLGPFLLGPAPDSMASKQGIWIFTSTGVRYLAETGEMGAEIPLPVEKELATVIRSLDDNYLFMAIPGSTKQAGVLVALDLKKGIAVSHDLPEESSKPASTGSKAGMWITGASELRSRSYSFARIGSKGGLWIMGATAMRSLSESGEVGDRSILLNKPRKQEEGDADSENIFAKGYSGETISLDKDHAAMLVTDSLGVSKHRIAVIDLKNFQIDSVLPTMTKGKKAAILIGQSIGKMLAAIVFPIYVWATLDPTDLGNTVIASSPDGRFVYALDISSQEITVIDVQAGTVLKRISVDNIGMIQASSDGKHLLCISPSPVTTVTSTIDFATNTLVKWNFKTTPAGGEK